MIKKLLFINSIFLLIFCLTSQQNEKDKYQPEINPSTVLQFKNAREIRRVGNYNEAIRLFKIIIKKDKDYYLANYNLALALAQNGKFKISIEYFEKSIKIKEEREIKDPTIYNSTGWAYMQLGDYKGAEMNFLKAISKEDSLSDKSKMKTFNNIGLLYMYIGDYIKSKKYFKSAIDLGHKLAEENLKILEILKRK